MKAETSARNRARTFGDRIAAATTDRALSFALVGWLLAEWRRLPAGVRGSERDPLLRVAREMNGSAKS